VECHFTIRVEKIYMKHRVYAPLHGKFESIINGGHHLDDLKRSMPLGCKLGSQLVCLKMTSFQPYLVSYVELEGVFVSNAGLLCLDHQFLGTLSDLSELLKV
jgi:hypothetical protein